MSSITSYILYFFIFVYFLAVCSGSSKEKSVATSGSNEEAKHVCHCSRNEVRHYEREHVEEAEHDDNVREYKKKLIQNEIQRLQEEYENLEFDMSPRKLRDWIRAEIKAATSS